METKHPVIKVEFFHVNLTYECQTRLNLPYNEYMRKCNDPWTWFYKGEDYWGGIEWRPVHREEYIETLNKWLTLQNV